MEHKETGCQVPPGAPKLCANNCGFFGIAATMNLCSKCHNDFVLKQEQAKLAAPSIARVVNEHVTRAVESATCTPSLDAKVLYSVEDGLNRCTTCRRRVGLIGFDCRCGNLFCAVHRYSDKHECPYDYRSAAQDAITRANPIVRAEKLDKI